MKQHRDNVKLRASATGGLHATSMGDYYPWSVQPRVWAMGTVGLTGAPQFRTMWQAFNALTGFEGGLRNTYARAEADMFGARTEEARERYAEGMRHAYNRK